MMTYLTTPYTGINPSQAADDLLETVERAFGYLTSLDESAITVRPAPGKWSRQEILGHLIDSAANNHQRFVRGQDVGELVLPGYEQDAWVARQDYQSASWPELLELWRLYNRHLAHVIRRIPPERLSTICRIGSYEPVSLGFIVADYVAHLKHHLRQLNVPDGA